jgi:hypothetical protein
LALTVASGAVLLFILGVRDAVVTLTDPRAVLLGVGGGLVVEALFLAGTRVGEWWERRWVPAASALALVLATLGGAAWLGPLVVAAACWGLATYVVVLVGTLLFGRAGTT